MFSNKEVAVFASGIGFGLSYMVFKLSYEMIKASANYDMAAIRDYMLRYQVLVFILYVALIIVQLLMLAVSKHFLKNPVKENFEKSGRLVGVSATLWLFAAISFIMALFDGLNFLAMWALQPGEAAKFSCFFYWFYRVYNDPIPELSQIAVLWQLPMILSEVLLGLIAYGRYFDAKRLFTRLYPNIVRSGIYNAFSSRSKNGDRPHIQTPEAIAENTGELSDGKTVTPQKPLGNNSLYSVDPPPKEKTIIKTQSEIDAEYEAFFSDAPPPVGNSSVTPPPKLTEEDYEQELIPTEFDFSKMKLSPDGGADNVKEGEGGEEKTACPLCGFLNVKGSAECEFCGAKTE